MQPSEARFFLRFESGDRAGETLPLEPGVLTLGRRPGNHIVFGHSSVSGKHAELRVDARSVELVDLGSTNGTRVGETQIERARLAHGDRLSIGQVELTLHDRSIGGTAPAPTRTQAPAVELPAGDFADPDATGVSAAGAGEGVGAISADALKASGKKGGILGLLVPAALLAAAAGGGYWWFAKGGSTELSGDTVPVVVVADNLFANGTLESIETALWTTTDASTGIVELDSPFAATGKIGLGSVLEDGEWFVARSGSFQARSRKSFAVRAACSADGGVARLGLELSPEGEGVPIVVWSSSYASGDFEDIALSFDGVSGYETARLLFAGIGPGVISLDDVVVQESEGAQSTTFSDYSASDFGGSTTASILRTGHPIIPIIQLDPWSVERLNAGETPVAKGALSVTATETGFTVEIPSGASTLRIVYAGETQGRVATISADGYRGYVGAFEQSNVDAVLIGFGADLAQLSFSSGTKVQGDRRADGLFLRIDAKGLESMEVRFDFQAVRTEARSLSSRANKANRAGNYGDALGLWDELLATFPYEKDLIQAAEAGRDLRTSEGLGSLETLRGEFERARFFELGDLYRQCAKKATHIADVFRGSEVEIVGRALAIEIDAARIKLAQGQNNVQVQLLDSVLNSTAAQAAPGLAAHLSKKGLNSDG